MSNFGRHLTTPNDHGPATVTRSRYTKTGLGAQLVVKGNPFSFPVGALVPCIPFLSLMGGRSPASNAARQTLLAQSNDPTALTLGVDPAIGGPVMPPATPPAGGANPAAGGGGAPAAVPSGAGGPFAYVGASKSGHS